MKNRSRFGNKYKKRRSSLYYKFVAIFIGLFALSLWFYHEISTLKTAEVWYETKAPASDLIFLPRDDAPHQGKMEWWYYNGHLLGESGKKYSFHDTVFLVNTTMNYMVNHVSFSDYQTGRHFTDQNSSAGNLSSGSINGFNFSAENWSMSGGNGMDKLQATAPEFNFDLHLNNKQAPIFQGKDGLITLGRAGSSYYYSRPRMSISGTIKVNGQSEAVTGVAWFDHQWGDFTPSQLIWEWFSLQLDDDSNIMIYQLRNKANQPILYSVSITKNDKTEILDKNEFILKAGKKWTSPKTGISYPTVWQIKIPAENIDLTASSVLSDCEFDAKLTSYNIYWEGAVKVSGSHSGNGFMELNGYSRVKN